MLNWLRWMGVIVGAVSIFNLVRQHSGFQLAPLLRQIVAFYSNTFHPPAEFIGWMVSQVIPTKLPPDLITFWMIIGAAIVRLTRATPRDWRQRPIEVMVSMSCIVLLWPVILVAVFALPYMPSSIQKEMAEHTDDTGWSLLVDLLDELAKVIAGFLFFFLLNAGMT